MPINKYFCLKRRSAARSLAVTSGFGELSSRIEQMFVDNRSRGPNHHHSSHRATIIKIIIIISTKKKKKSRYIIK